MLLFVINCESNASHKPNEKTHVKGTNTQFYWFNYILMRRENQQSQKNAITVRRSETHPSLIFPLRLLSSIVFNIHCRNEIQGSASGCVRANARWLCFVVQSVAMIATYATLKQKQFDVATCSSVIHYAASLTEHKRQIVLSSYFLSCCRFGRALPSH